MQVKRAYVNIEVRTTMTYESPPIYESQVRLGWRIGLVGIVRAIDPSEEGKWSVVHIPTGKTMSFVDSFAHAKALARMFMVAGVSDKTTMEDVETDPLWHNMRRTYHQWWYGHD